MTQEALSLAHENEKNMAYSTGMAPSTGSFPKEKNDQDVGSIAPYVDPVKEGKMMRKFDVSAHGSL